MGRDVRGALHAVLLATRSVGGIVQGQAVHVELVTHDGGGCWWKVMFGWVVSERRSVTRVEMR